MHMPDERAIIIVGSPFRYRDGFCICSSKRGKPVKPAVLACQETVPAFIRCPYIPSAIFIYVHTDDIDDIITGVCQCRVTVEYADVGAPHESEVGRHAPEYSDHVPECADVALHVERCLPRVPIAVKFPSNPDDRIRLPRHNLLGNPKIVIIVLASGGFGGGGNRRGPLTYDERYRPQQFAAGHGFPHIRYVPN